MIMHSPHTMSQMKCVVLYEYIPRLVESFETIVLSLVDQDDFQMLDIVGEDITVVAERVS